MKGEKKVQAGGVQNYPLGSGLGACRETGEKRGSFRGYHSQRVR